MEGADDEDSDCFGDVTLRLDDVTCSCLVGIIVLSEGSDPSTEIVLAEVGDLHLSGIPLFDEYC